MTPLRRYVALGDSFTAGLPDDGHPAWPKLVADGLEPRCPELRYFNLGVVGATAAQVVEQQVPAAIVLGADLVTLVCGLNDALWTLRPDPDAFRALLAGSLTGLAQLSPPPVVVLATLADVTATIPFRSRSRARVARAISAFNGVIRDVATGFGCPLVDVESSPRLSDPSAFAADGIHATRQGHRWMAEAVVREIDEVLSAVRR